MSDEKRPAGQSLNEFRVAAAREFLARISNPPKPGTPEYEGHWSTQELGRRSGEAQGIIGSLLAVIDQQADQLPAVDTARPAALAMIRELTEQGLQVTFVPPDERAAFEVVVCDVVGGCVADRTSESPEAALAAAYTEATGTASEPVKDAPVYPAPGSDIPDQPGYVVGTCGHRVAGSEWRAGFRVCERCPSDEWAEEPADGGEAK